MSTEDQPGLELHLLREAFPDASPYSAPSQGLTYCSCDGQQPTRPVEEHRGCGALALRLQVLWGGAGGVVGR